MKRPCVFVLSILPPCMVSLPATELGFGGGRAVNCANNRYADTEWMFLVAVTTQN